MTIATQPVSKRIQATADDDHEQVVIRQDPETGLRFIVAVHSTVLGPSLGGMRVKRYPGGLREALDDVMGLARTMTLKASAAGLDLGGGKSVMIDDGRAEMRRARLEGAARTIESLNGAYITAEDIGTTCADMDYVARFTRFCVGRSRENGGRGDPSPITAETVFQAIVRGLEAHDGSSELTGRRVGVIGVGKVCGRLAARLADAGAHVVACDLDGDRCAQFASEHGAEIAPSAEAILGLELDVLAPCAAGGVIDDPLARSIDIGGVAGAANNPLTSRKVARALMERGILYVPDFLANCGGLIPVSGGGDGDKGGSEGERIARAMDRLHQGIAPPAARGSPPPGGAGRP